MRKRQELSVVVITSGDADHYPLDAVQAALRGADGIELQSSWSDDDYEELPEVNRERLIRLAAWVAGEDAKRRLGLPNEWNQKNWFARSNPEQTGSACGTACCVAGKVALEDGGVPVFDGPDTPWSGKVQFPGEDESAYVEEYAREALELTDAQANRLFDGNNDLDDILAAIASLLDVELVQD